jgi:hypothetical protein
MTRVSQGTPLHGGLQGQKHHIIPARGNFLSSREENVPDSVFKDSIVEPSMCGPQPEQNGTVMGERSRPPATATDIKGILPTCGIKPVGDGTVRLKLIVEDATWPEYALFDSRSWSSHQRHLEPDASRPGIRFVLSCPSACMFASTITMTGSKHAAPHRCHLADSDEHRVLPQCEHYQD